MKYFETITAIEQNMEIKIVFTPADLRCIYLMPEKYLEEFRLLVLSENPTNKIAAASMLADAVEEMRCNKIGDTPTLRIVLERIRRMFERRGGKITRK